MAIASGLEEVLETDPIAGETVLILTAIPPGGLSEPGTCLDFTSVGS